MALTTMGPQKAVRPVSLLASCRVEDRRVGASLSAGGMFEGPGVVGDARWSARNDDAAPRLKKALLASRRQGLALGGGLGAAHREGSSRSPSSSAERLRWLTNAVAGKPLACGGRRLTRNLTLTCRDCRVGKCGHR